MKAQSRAGRDLYLFGTRKIADTNEVTGLGEVGCNKGPAVSSQ